MRQRTCAVISASTRKSRSPIGIIAALPLSYRRYVSALFLVADRGAHRRPLAALAFEIACTRRNGLPSSQTVIHGRLGSPLDQEHCEHAIPYLGAQCGDFQVAA